MASLLSARELFAAQCAVVSAGALGGTPKRNPKYTATRIPTCECCGYLHYSYEECIIDTRKDIYPDR